MRHKHEEPLVCLSTAHLTQEEAQTHLDCLSSMRRAEGALVNVRGCRPRVDEEEMPSMLACLEWAQSMGFVWILFDRDQEPTEELESYDW